VPREIKENDNGDDDDEKKTAAAGVVKAYSSKTNSQWEENICAHTYIDEHWVADCPITSKIAATFSITQYRHKRCIYIPLLSLFFSFLSFILILYLSAKNEDNDCCMIITLDHHYFH
jgi:hypothetical protein